MIRQPFTFFLTPTSNLETKETCTVDKLSRKPSTPTPLLTRQEVKRRATLQVDLTSPSSSTITLHREPHGSTPTDTLPSPHHYPNDSDLSDTDSSTGSPTLTATFPISKGLIKMNNDEKQPLAEVQTAKMKDCPILTAGRITPLVLQSWALVCK